jgi:hypothetical protein
MHSIIRLGGVLLLLFFLSRYKPLADQALVAKPITGFEALRASDQLVELKATVLYVKFNELGSKLITLQTADGQQPIALIQPSQDIITPNIGDYVSITGKLLGRGLLSVESIKPLRRPILGGAGDTVAYPQIVGKRVTLRITQWKPEQFKSRRGFYHAAFRTMAGAELTGTYEGHTSVPQMVEYISGYLLDSGTFYIERLQ